MKQIPPIAIFAFKRPDHLRRLAHTLEACEGFREHPVTIFIDGPRRDADRAGVDAVRTVATDLGWENLTIVEAPANLGLRRSIHKGVSKLLEDAPSVIVLEDDLLLAPCALVYFRRALEAYENHPNVYAVGGYAYPVPELADRAEVVFLPYATSWGWATWRRAWSGFSVEKEEYRSLHASKSFRAAFAAPNIISALTMFDLLFLGKIDSWAILWNAYISRSGGISVFPPKTVVKNSGLSGVGATHSSTLNYAAKLRSRHDSAAPMLDSARELVMPNMAKADYSAVDLTRNSVSCRLDRASQILGAIRRRIRFWR